MIFTFFFFQQLTSGYGIYSSYRTYKNLKDIDEGKSIVSRLPVTYKYFKGMFNVSEERRGGLIAIRWTQNLALAGTLRCVHLMFEGNL